MRVVWSPRMGNSSWKERRSFIGEGVRVKLGRAWRWGWGKKGFSHGNTQMLNVLGHRTQLCLWENPNSGEGRIPVSQIGRLRPGEDGESSSVFSHWLITALRRDANSLPWAQGSRAPLNQVRAGSAHSPVHTAGLLSEPPPQLHPPGAHLLSHCERVPTWARQCPGLEIGGEQSENIASWHSCSTRTGGMK